jgi:hypothetical protein
MRVGIHLVALALAWLCAACTTTVDVVVDEREDFSRYRSWDWLPRPAPSVDEPQSLPPALDARLAWLVERSLRARGLERTGDGADFFVTYHLEGRRRAMIVDQPFAPYLLDSHHSSPSYWIEGSDRVTRIYEDLRLGIGVTDGRGRVTWQAWLEQSVEAGSGLPLEAAVAKLVERFPEPGQRDGGAGRR